MEDFNWAEVVEGLERYAHIRVTSQTDDNPHTVVGQYRARVVSTNNFCFDRDGSAIWVTSDQGWEAFIDIPSIVSIDVVPRDCAVGRSGVCENVTEQMCADCFQVG